MTDAFAEEHDRRAAIMHEIADRMEKLSIPEKEIIRILDDIQNVEYVNRKESQTLSPEDGRSLRSVWLMEMMSRSYTLGVAMLNDKPKCRDENQNDPCEGMVLRQPYRRNQDAYIYLCRKHEAADRKWKK